MSSTACIKWIKIGSPSFKPTLILLALSQVDCTNPCIASLIFLALDLVIGPSGTCKGSLRLGSLWSPSEREQIWEADVRESRSRQIEFADWLGLGFVIVVCLRLGM